MARVEATRQSAWLCPLLDAVLGHAEGIPDHITAAFDRWDAIAVEDTGCSGPLLPALLERWAHYLTAMEYERGCDPRRALLANRDDAGHYEAAFQESMLLRPLDEVLRRRLSGFFMGVASEQGRVAGVQANCATMRAECIVARRTTSRVHTCSPRFPHTALYVQVL